MRFAILGPVEVSADGRRVPGAAPRHRAVLGYLLLHAGTVLSADRLIDAMWGLTPPDTARAQIHAAVTAIRRVLRQAQAAQLLETRAAGYVILPRPGQLDLEEFTGRVAAARGQADADPAGAARQIRAALELWRGQPFADVHVDYVPDARARLDERRLTAFEQLAELELSLGRHDALIDELAAQVSAHPLRERLSGHLMLALHRAGRQTDALSVARNFRATLGEQQGLEPGRAFVTLERAILRDDPQLDLEPGSGYHGVIGTGGSASYHGVIARGSRVAYHGVIGPEGRANYHGVIDPGDPETYHGVIHPAGPETDHGVIDPGGSENYHGVIGARTPSGPEPGGLPARPAGRQPAGDGEVVGGSPSSPGAEQGGGPGVGHGAGQGGSGAGAGQGGGLGHGPGGGAGRTPPDRQPRRANFLPYDTPDFAGRAVELDRLLPERSGGGGQVTVSAIDGMAGIGKTTLAIHAGHRLAERFPDGQLFVDLQAHTVGQAPVEAGAALEILLRQLGVPAERIPASDVDRAALWRAELSGRRVLAVLDNAAGTDHVRPLLPGATRSLVLITSRRRLTGLDGAHALSLDLLPATDAIELFTRIVGERADAEPLAVLDVLHLCGFLPLAVRIAAARLHHRPQWTVAYLADRLRDQRRRLTELSTSERGVAAAFGLSYQQLAPDQQRIFRLLGLHPGRDFDSCATAALAGVPLEKAEMLLEDLLDAHVLVQHEPGRYTFHDLLREHARATACAVETADARRAALTRLFDHYLYTALTAIDVLFPDGKERRPRVPRPKTPLVSFGGSGEATGWLDAERANLIAVGSYTADQEWPAHTTRLATVLHRYLYDRAHHADALALYAQALRASRRLGDTPAEGRVLTDLGWLYWRQGRDDQAAEHARRALELCRGSGDRLGQARALHALGFVCLRRREDDQAHAHFGLALELFRGIGDRLGEAAALAGVGTVHERLGRLEQAHAHHRQALALYRELGNAGGEAVALGNLGVVFRRQGRLPQAHHHFRRAAELHGELGNRGHHAEILNGLGDTARAMGDPGRALEHHGAALALACEVGFRPEAARAHTGLARAHRDLGRTSPARHHAGEALTLYPGTGVREAEEIRAFLVELDSPVEPDEPAGWPGACEAGAARVLRAAPAPPLLAR